MIAYVDEAGYIGKRIAGTEVEAALKNESLEARGLEGEGFWVHLTNDFKFCRDCGRVGESKGHMGCEYPED